MKSPFINLLKALAALLILGLGSSLALGKSPSETITTVSLRSTVRLTQDPSELTIDDIATVTGPQSTAIQALEINTTGPIAVGQWTTIKADTIRELIEHSPKINAGSIIIVGSDIAITQRSNSKASNQAPRADSSEPTIPAGPTLRDQIKRWISTRPWLKSDQDSTRIIFPQTDRIRALLDTPITGRTVILNEIGRSKLISCKIVIYENELLIEETTIRFDVQVRRQTRVTTAQIRRKELINDQNSTIETRWVSPMTPIVAPQNSVGQATRQTIDPGTLLLVAMIEQPILIKRGAIVSARSLAGSISVTMSVRALSNGRLGEIIELESRDRKQRFNARVAGEGRVVIVKKPAKQAKLTPRTADE